EVSLEPASAEAGVAATRPPRASAATARAPIRLRERAGSDMTCLSDAVSGCPGDTTAPSGWRALMGRLGTRGRGKAYRSKAALTLTTRKRLGQWSRAVVTDVSR